MRQDIFLTIVAYKELEKHIAQSDSIQDIKRYLQIMVVHDKGRHCLFYNFKILPGIFQTNAVLLVLRQIAAKLELTLSALPNQNNKITAGDKKLLTAFGL